MSLFKINRAMTLLVVGTSFGLLAGCGGSSTGSDGKSTVGTQFVSDETTTGSLELELKDDTLEVGQTAGFFAHVRDENGKGIPSISVACDSERGVALIDPLLGRAMTDSNGSVSGIWGCESPGSFQVGCRMATGGNRRQFATIKCTGNPPSGFTGFPGAGGGGLGSGGGVLDPGSGGPGSVDGLVRIADIQVVDISGESDAVPEIDLSQSLCEGGATPNDTSDDTLEGWGDDEVVITIQNDSDRVVEFTGFRYVVKAGQSNGTDYESSLIRDFARAQARAESTVTISAAIFDATVSGFKSYDRPGATIPTDGRRRNVRFTVFGVDDRGEEVSLSATVSMNFDHYGNCSAE